MRVTYSDIEDVIAEADKLKDVVRLEQGEPAFRTPRHIQDAAVAALRAGYTKYTEIDGLLELRKAIAHKLKMENGLDANPESEVIVTAGASEAVFTAMQAVLDPGDEALIPDPGYVSYERCVSLAGGVPVYYPLKPDREFRIDIETMKERITHRTKLVLINSPGNPAGNVFTKNELSGVSDVCVDNDLIAIADEVYEKIVYDGNKHLSLGSFPGMEQRTITVNSFSKTYAMTGWRIGYAVASGQLADQVRKVHSTALICVDSLAQYGALAALSGPQDCVKRMLLEYQKRRKSLVTGLNKMNNVSCDMPQGAFFAFADISKLGIASRDLSLKLLREGKVSTIPGSGFGRMGEGRVRISFTASPKDIEEGVRRISRVVTNA